MEFTLFKQRTASLVGVDISSSSVKLLELSHTPQGYCVERYAREPLPRDAMQENEIKDIKALGNAVARVVKQARTRTKYAAIALASSKVFKKVIEMNAKLKEQELGEQIQSKAQSYIPFAMSEVSMDFQVLKDFSKNPEWVDVLLVASRKQTLDTLVEVLSLGGLTAKVVDIEAYAIERAFSLLSDQLPHKGEQQTIAIVDIGWTMTKFIVLHDSSTVFTRDHSFAFPENYLALVQKVKRFLQLFFSSTQFCEVDHIILAGETAMLPGLVQLVEEKLAIPTRIALPFENMCISPRVSASALHENTSSMILCGLAMRRFIHEHQY